MAHTKRAKAGKRSVEAKLREARRDLHNARDAHAEWVERCGETERALNLLGKKHDEAATALAHEYEAHGVTRKQLAASDAEVVALRKQVAELERHVREQNDAELDADRREERLEREVDDARAALVKLVKVGSFAQSDTWALAVGGTPRRAARAERQS